MITKRITVNSPDADKAGIAEAAEILRRGGTVAIPTETVYGLAANALEPNAVAKIFAAKGRPQDNPLIVHIADLEMLYNVAAKVPETALKLAEKFWPGPLTMVLERGEKIPGCISAGLPTVAVRMPSNEVARSIIRECGLPLAAPSANLSGSPSPTTAQHVLDDLDGRIDAVVMSDCSAVGVESTVVLLANGQQRLLRPGRVTPEELSSVIGEVEIDSSVLTPHLNGAVSSPGMKYKHYSPKTKVVIIDADADKYIDYVNSAPGNVGALCFSEEAAKVRVPCLEFGSADDALSQAHGLFSALREADSLGVGVVYAHCPRRDGVGLAVYNRLLRAAAFEVISL